MCHPTQLNFKTRLGRGETQHTGQGLEGSNRNPRCCRSQPRGEGALLRLLGAPSTVLPLRGVRSPGSSEQPSREGRGGATASWDLVWRRLGAASRRRGVGVGGGAERTRGAAGALCGLGGGALGRTEGV